MEVAKTIVALSSEIVFTFFRKYLFGLLFFVPLAGFSQTMRISGNVQDTVTKAPLQYAVVMVVKVNDSLLTGHTRTTRAGMFELKSMPLDTYQVIISHPQFGDRNYFVFGSQTNNSFDLGTIILPPKNYLLNEVVIYAFKDPIYYRGDTLVFTTDSFKVKKNATVEDLLKKLPGISVDKKGGITAQGKKVDQVLVDGDEFFGSDPTVATKNLSATDLESVQVYDKKNENESAAADAEELKVMNLKLKEKAKKGSFGKISGAGDFDKFYEGEMLVNKFRGNQKISVFGLATNTPRTYISFEEMMKYGLIDLPSIEMDEFSYSTPEGIPRALKGGIFYSDKWSKKTKATINYSYNSIEITKNTDSKSHYFLTDTNYFSNNSANNLQKNEIHNLDLNLTSMFDSLTELTIGSKSKFGSTIHNKHDSSDYVSENGALTRSTMNDNRANGQSYNNNSKLQVIRSFKKKDRKLILNYALGLIDSKSSGTLQSLDEYYFVQLNDSSINQQKTTTNTSQMHTTSILYKEPVNNKIKLEFWYGFLFDKNLQDKQTLDFANGSYSLEDTLFSNKFENIKNSSSIGGKFIYETNKHLFNMGATYRQASIASTNLITGQKISQVVNNVLPSASYRCKFTKTQNLIFSYTTDLKQPTINQLQPVPDNSNTNKVYLGNPNLLPMFTQSFHLRYSDFKPVSGSTVWGSTGYSILNNAFSNSISYDSNGRTITQPVNVDGNYNANTYMGFELPVIKNWGKIKPNVSFNYSSNTNYINSMKNITSNAVYKASVSISRQSEKYEVEISGSYVFNNPKSTLNVQSSKPYYSQEYTADASIQLFKKLSIESDINYQLNHGRTEGYNINYFVWNVSLSRTFLKQENLIISINGYDILNQNVNADRNVQDNVITDTKTNIINRYFLLKALFKFNNNNKKDDDEEF